MRNFEGCLDGGFTPNQTAVIPTGLPSDVNAMDMSSESRVRIRNVPVEHMFTDRARRLGSPVIRDYSVGYCGEEPLIVPSPEPPKTGQDI